MGVMKRGIGGSQGILASPPAEEVYPVRNVNPEQFQSMGAKCYSDHNEDIRTKGSCDMCGDTKKD